MLEEDRAGSFGVLTEQEVEVAPEKVPEVPGKAANTVKDFQDNLDKDSWMLRSTKAKFQCGAKIGMKGLSDTLGGSGWPERSKIRRKFTLYTMRRNWKKRRKVVGITQQWRLSSCALNQAAFTDIKCREEMHLSWKEQRKTMKVVRRGQVIIRLDHYNWKKRRKKI